ncbi:MAG: DUF881 domain-containing protein [Chloroflexi bacterium]|nr:DUF881 domain-containing protein [Chloroflexota bacterium]
MSNVLHEPSHEPLFSLDLARLRASLPYLRPHPTKWGATKGAATLMVLGLGVGLMLAAQLQAAPPKPSTVAEGSRQVAGATIERLEAEQGELKKQISQLRAQIANQQQEVTSHKYTLAGLTQDLERQQVAAGSIPLKGSGVRVILDDSAAKTVPSGDDPAFYLVHEYHLRDVVNLLWQAGAEAISVNGERLVSSSSIYCVGSTIMINDTRMSPPFDFLALGNSAALEEALLSPANLKAFKVRVKSYGVQFRVAKSKDIVVPAFSGSLDVRYAAIEYGR